MAHLGPHGKVAGRKRAHGPGVLLLLGLRPKTSKAHSLLVNLKHESRNKAREEKTPVTQMVSY